MGYKRFNLNIFLRIILIVLTAIWFGIELQNDQKAYTKFLCISLVLIQSISLIQYLNKMNSEILRFLQILNIDDSAYRFSSDLKGNFSKLAKILNNTADLIINSRIEKEKQYQFLQFVIEQINIGLMAFNSNGEIQFANSYLKNILKVDSIKNIDDLKELNIELVNSLKLSQAKLNFQIRLTIDNEPIQLYVQKKQIKINSENIHLVSLQNITAELDKKELDSWQKLIRVLTHEIMNSITPITNLTYSIQRSLKESNFDLKNNLAIADTIDDVEIIEKRSKSLLQFVENYRKLTRLGKINIHDANISEILKNAIEIFKEDFKTKQIACELDLDESINCKVDDKLLEQAIINLIKNAAEANCTKISLTLRKENNETLVIISDNGEGIDQDKLDDVFIPFYTSKEKGTGIGLSFVKQIISLHKGTIVLSSKIGVGTSFIIKL
ncbi:MAG: HAMP domain-containing histidine kinase [Bacteroidales bacterium]|nr:HAMP domain-containing histidine kinase [Bacteroidales bacterium]